MGKSGEMRLRQAIVLSYHPCRPSLFAGSFRSSTPMQCGMTERLRTRNWRAMEVEVRLAWDNHMRTSPMLVPL